MSVEFGWGGVVRYGRWNPVLITLADPDNPNAIVELAAPHDAIHGIRIRQFVGTLESRPKTFVLYVPVNQYFSYGSSPVSVVVRNADTRKLLAATKENDRSFQFVQNINVQDSFVAVSGRRTTLNELRSPAQNRLKTGFLPIEALPASAMGYDAADAVVLNAADLNAMTDEQQQAVLDWIRAGGSLVYWPGDEPVPSKSPLVDVLPCRIGAATVLKMSTDGLERAGLPSRFAAMPGRDLTPAPEAERVPLFDSESVNAYRGRLGLGLIVVSPVNLGDLQFQNESQARAVWKRALEGMVELPEPPAPGEQPAYYGDNPRQNAQFGAENAVADLLGSVPGAGQFGFSYVVVVLIGLMVVVGPVDWFVLRMLRRQPWTWVTTTGWVALVTLGALYIGHVFKSGDLHVRTFAVVDQVGNATVARTDYFGVYSPRSDTYVPEVPADSWWRPMAPGQQFYGGNPTSEAAFQQTYRGNTPQPMFINVWSLRFLQGQTLSAGPAVIEADLKVTESNAQGERIMGTLKNVSNKPLRNVRLISRAGTSAASALAIAPVIAPGAESEINFWITRPQAASDNQQPPANRFQSPYNPYGRSGASIDPLDLAQWLGWTRMEQIERLIKDDNAVCILAEQNDADPAAGLAAENTLEKHWLVVRAVVPLQSNQGER